MARLPTARTSTLGETTIPPSWRRIGPGDGDHLYLAAVVDASPEPPEAIKAGILAMVKASTEKGLSCLEGWAQPGPLLSLIGEVTVAVLDIAPENPNHGCRCLR